MQPTHFPLRLLQRWHCCEPVPGSSWQQFPPRQSLDTQRPSSSTESPGVGDGARHDPVTTWLPGVGVGFGVGDGVGAAVGAWYRHVFRPFTT